MTAVSIAVAYVGIVNGDKDVKGAWLLVPMAVLLGWLTYKFVINLVRPPKLEVSRNGLSWTNFDAADANYRWQDIEGPQLKKVGRSALFMCFVVKATGRKVDLPLNDIGRATYDEIAAVISSAREGSVISPEEWRVEHPQHSFRRWMINWALPVAGGILWATVLIHFFR
jgi:hypothetical protein